VAVGVFVDGAANRCTIRVEDSGPGVPPEFLRQMFEPFVRLRKSKGQGVGLGLAIAKRAIAVHGGSIEAANRPEGGLCVTIVLPLEPPE
jgi:two-component system OmpR family sensor kinase